ncbi:MAG: patatin-like phospholipase family protein [Synergistaceae bacterium]|jgi:NTE family protein|nr:patatin-like phospholipase family protein [Synergistaceae bacterium]
MACSTKKNGAIEVVCMVLLAALLGFAAPAPLAWGAKGSPPGVGGGSGRRGGVVLVLSGGGTKGFAHIGVLKVLEREKIPVAGIVGTSIGSVIGGLYACGYSADEIREIVSETNVLGLLADSGTRVKPDAGEHRPAGESVRPYHMDFDKSFKRSGPLGMLPAVSLASFLVKYTGHIQTADFNDLPIPFACVAADLGTGEEVVMRSGSLSSSIRASASIPGLTEPWPVDGRLLVDGGLVANLPVAIAKDIFPGYPVIAVNLSGASIAKPNERFRSMVDVMMQTIDIMTVDRIKSNELMADVVLYPDVSEFSMLDASGYDVIYQRGLDAALANAGRIIAVSEGAPPPPLGSPGVSLVRVVRSVRVTGLNRGAASDIESEYRDWEGKPYDAEKVNHALERIAKRDNIATVDVDTYPAEDGSPDEVDMVFSVEKRPAYEIGVDGYATNLHTRRWAGITFNARDIAADGDSANFDLRVGDDSWGAALGYFTPLRDGGQWGVSLGARSEKFFPRGMDEYHLDRYSLRGMYYWERNDSRVGFGIAGDRIGGRRGETKVGPYFYYNRDTLDNLIIPSRGYSINSQIWWGDMDTLVSRSNFTAYLPLMNDLHLVTNVGLYTGDKSHRAYRALLGDREELFSLAGNPLPGDEAAWAHLGVGKYFYNSWWGAVRGELFASYGIVMDDWSRTAEAWEAGLALSVPGQFLNGRLLLVYDDDNELTLGFTLGNPKWWASPLP